MKTYEVVTLILALGLLVNAIPLIFADEPEPTCTLSTDVGDNQTIHQIKLDSVCEEMRKNSA